MGGVLIDGLHCGIELRPSGAASESFHEPGSVLSIHAHQFPHTTKVLNGGYLERRAGQVFLRLPGETVIYDEAVEHENWFGSQGAVCENLPGRRVSTPARKLNPLASRAASLIESGSYRLPREVANDVGVHPDYLTRLYRRWFGISPGLAIRRVRLQRAVGLLAETSETIGEIAQSLEYFDQSHFTNELRMLGGFLPSQVRELLGKKV